MDEKIFSSMAELILSKARGENRLLLEPNLESLREWSEKDEATLKFGQKRIKTRYGNYCFLSRITSRSAPQTLIVWDNDDERSRRACMKGHAVLGGEHEELLKRVEESLKKEELIVVQRAMGNAGEGLSFQCRLVVPKKFARLALMFDALLFEGNASKPADMSIVMAPDFEERKILVNPKENVTFVLGSDYFGEVKKGCLRMISEVVREEFGGYSFHMGLQTRIVNGREKVIALAGLSGTGKTTLSLNGENKRIHQDDFIFVIPRGASYKVVGPEKGFYVKTEDLTEKTYPGLWKGLTSSGAVMENVFVNEETGEIETLNHKIKSFEGKTPSECRNGRAVLSRHSVPDTNCSCGSEKIDVLGIITRRRDVFPLIVKLSPEQFVAVFCVGPSVKTSAADPNARGEPVMEYGTDPFHIGVKAAYANKLLEFLRAHPEIELVMVNTGRIGKKLGSEGVNFTAEDSQAALDALVDGTIEWKKDESFGWLTPTAIPGVSSEKLDAKKHYSQEEYDEIRREVLLLYSQQLERINSEMPGSKLDESILNALARE